MVDVELLVCDEPPLEALLVVEDCVPALLVPSWPVLPEDPVVVVVPADAPEPARVCAEPLAEVVVEAVPVPVGVGVTVPAGLCEFDWLLPFPEDDWPELDVPAPVLAVPAPDPCAAFEPELDGVVVVLEPV